MEQMRADIRPSPIAGKWYPGNARRLTASVDALLAGASIEWVSDKPVRGLIVPHAGHRYSGPVAAVAFKAVAGAAYERVVILSPYHNLHAGDVITTAHSGYETPLGTVPVDTNFIGALAGRVRLTRVRHDPEHAVEIELPFLQRTLIEGWKLVPIMLRNQSLDMVELLGDALAELADDHTLLIASSDLSHFYPDEMARRLDRIMLDQVKAMDPAGVIQAEERGKAFACGRGAIAAVLRAAQGMGATEARIVAYGTSGDTSGDRQRVVGYGAAVVQ